MKKATKLIMFAIGMMVLSTNALAQKTAEEWFLDGLEAEWELWDDHMSGIKNRTSANTAYQKAAELGNVDAQLILALCNVNGSDGEPNPKKAFYWFIKAAEHGDAWAQYRIAECYKEGFGVEKDDAKALYWSAKTSKTKSNEAYEFFRAYKQRYGEKLRHRINMAAERGDAEAQFKLALYYKTIFF